MVYEPSGWSTRRRSAPCHTSSSSRRMHSVSRFRAASHKRRRGVRSAPAATRGSPGGHPFRTKARASSTPTSCSWSSRTPLPRPRAGSGCSSHPAFTPTRERPSCASSSSAHAGGSGFTALRTACRSSRSIQASSSHRSSSRWAGRLRPSVLRSCATTSTSGRDPSEHAITIEVADVQRFSPATWSFLELKDDRDLEIVERIYADHELLGDVLRARGREVRAGVQHDERVEALHAALEAPRGPDRAGTIPAILASVRACDGRIRTAVRGQVVLPAQPIRAGERPAGQHREVCAGLDVQG